MSKKWKTTAHANNNDHPIHKMIATQHHKNDQPSQQELKEVRAMSRTLRKLKRQMFLQQVEAPTPVDSFRSLMVGLATEEGARRRDRSELSSRASSFDDTRPLGQIQE